jgi:hypothetical protein
MTRTVCAFTTARHVTVRLRDRRGDDRPSGRGLRPPLERPRVLEVARVERRLSEGEEYVRNLLRERPMTASAPRLAPGTRGESNARHRVLAAVDEAIGPDAADPWVFVDHARPCTRH